jgi:hypothetical protein
MSIMIAKRITSALILAGFSSMAFAGTMGNPVEAPTGVNVVAPTTSGTWVFGLEAIYAQPGEVFQYASRGHATDDGVTFTNKGGPSYNDWGFSADVGYIFPDTGLDVQLGYTYLALNNENRWDSTNNIQPVLSGPNTAADLGTGFNSAQAHASQDLNQITLTMGQAIQATKYVYLHPFIGLEYANIRTIDTINYTGNTAQGFVADDSIYNGIGPRAGIDGAFRLGYGFSIFGSAAGALLLGDMNTGYRITSSRTDTNLSLSNDNNLVLVPELEGKIGLEYLYPFTPTSELSIQLGYEAATTYFNAESQDLNDVINVNTTSNLSNFSYQGVFLRLQQSFH